MQESSQGKPDTWPLQEPSRKKDTRGLRSRQAGFADPDESHHPESCTRGRHIIKTAKYTRGLHSRQAGSADPEESHHPESCTRGAFKV